LLSPEPAHQSNNEPHLKSRATNRLWSRSVRRARRRVSRFPGSRSNLLRAGFSTIAKSAFSAAPIGDRQYGLELDDITPPGSPTVYQLRASHALHGESIWKRRSSDLCPECRPSGRSRRPMLHGGFFRPMWRDGRLAGLQRESGRDSQQLDRIPPSDLAEHFWRTQLFPCCCTARVD
jgi:hypothetical protein